VNNAVFFIEKYYNKNMDILNYLKIYTKIEITSSNLLENNPHK